MQVIMKVLQVTQKGIAIAGINSDQHRFNRKTLFCLFVFGLCITSQCVFIFRTANNFIEYTDCVYKTGTTISIAVCYTSLVFYKKKLFSFINDIEEIANKSEQSKNVHTKIAQYSLVLNNISGLQDPKSKAMFLDVDENIEKWSKIVYFVSVILSPISLILPNIILSFYTYFTTDLRENAFVLLIPMWYVHLHNAYILY